MRFRACERSSDIPIVAEEAGRAGRYVAVLGQGIVFFLEDAGFVFGFNGSIVVLALAAVMLQSAKEQGLIVAPGCIGKDVWGWGMK